MAIKKKLKIVNNQEEVDKFNMEKKKKEKKKKKLVVNMSNPQQIKVKKVYGLQENIRGITDKDDEKIEGLRFKEIVRKNEAENQTRINRLLKELRDFFTIDKGIYSKSKTIQSSTALQEYKEIFAQRGGKIPPTLLEKINKKLKKK